MRQHKNEPQRAADVGAISSLLPLALSVGCVQLEFSVIIVFGLIAYKRKLEN
jgi:hypothetical protein